MDWQTISAIAATTAVLGGFFVWFWRRGLPGFRKWSRRADELFGIPACAETGQPHVAGIGERMDTQDALLEVIRHEVETNTGTSLKDAVKAQGRTLEQIQRRLDMHLTPGDQSTTININNPPEGG